jgi:hypothetical protein
MAKMVRSERLVLVFCCNLPRLNVIGSGVDFFSVATCHVTGSGQEFAVQGSSLNALTLGLVLTGGDSCRVCLGPWQSIMPGDKRDLRYGEGWILCCFRDLHVVRPCIHCGVHHTYRA